MVLDCSPAHGFVTNPMFPHVLLFVATGAPLHGCYQDLPCVCEQSWEQTSFKTKSSEGYAAAPLDYVISWCI